MSDYFEARRQAERLKTAVALMDSDVRFRRLVDSVTACALEDVAEHYPQHPDDVSEYAHRAARQSAILTLARVYTEDAEMVALRQERDIYKKVAEESLSLTPRPVIVTRHIAGFK